MRCYIFIPLLSLVSCPVVSWAYEDAAVSSSSGALEDVNMHDLVVDSRIFEAAGALGGPQAVQNTLPDDAAKLEIFDTYLRPVDGDRFTGSLTQVPALEKRLEEVRKDTELSAYMGDGFLDRASITQKKLPAIAISWLRFQGHDYLSYTSTQDFDNEILPERVTQFSTKNQKLFQGRGLPYGFKSYLRKRKDNFVEAYQRYYNAFQKCVQNAKTQEEARRNLEESSEFSGLFLKGYAAGLVRQSGKTSLQSYSDLHKRVAPQGNGMFTSVPKAFSNCRVVTSDSQGEKS